MTKAWHGEAEPPQKPGGFAWLVFEVLGFDSLRWLRSLCVQALRLSARPVASAIFLEADGALLEISKWKSVAGWPVDLSKTSSWVSSPQTWTAQKPFSSALHLGTLRAVPSWRSSVLLQVTLLNDGEAAWGPSKLCDAGSNITWDLVSCFSTEWHWSKSCDALPSGEILQLYIRIPLSTTGRSSFSLCDSQPFGVLMSFQISHKRPSVPVLTQAVWHVSVSLLLILAQDGQSSAHLIEQHVWTHPVLMGLQGLTGLDGLDVL